MNKECPTCGADMERYGLTGRDSKGRDVGVTWHECPECETHVDDFGEVWTKEDRQRAEAEALREIE